jgi:hypothetical protein
MDLERLERIKREFAPRRGELFSIALAAVEGAAGKRVA